MPFLDMALKGSEINVEVDTHRRFERAWNRFQIVLYVLMLACVAAGLLGVFGGGWLSYTDVEIPGATSRLHYERYLRAKNETSWKVTLSAATPTVRVAVSESIADAFKVSSTVPRPREVRTEQGGVAMEFDSLGASATIIFRAEPVSFGLVHGWFEVAGGRVPIDLVIYP